MSSTCFYQLKLPNEVRSKAELYRVLVIAVYGVEQGIGLYGGKHSKRKWLKRDLTEYLIGVMPIPNNVEAFLELPVYVVNLEVAASRFHTVAPRIQQAGFKKCFRYLGVHGANHQQRINAYATLGNPRLTQTDMWFLHSAGRQGCLLSHLLLWKYIIEQQIPAVVVLEDDVCFHSRWNEVLPDFVQKYPKKPTSSIWDANSAKVVLVKS